MNNDDSRSAKEARDGTRVRAKQAGLPQQELAAWWRLAEWPASRDLNVVGLFAYNSNKTFKFKWIALP